MKLLKSLLVVCLISVSAIAADTKPYGDYLNELQKLLQKAQSEISKIEMEIAANSLKGVCNPKLQRDLGQWITLNNGAAIAIDDLIKKGVQLPPHLLPYVTSGNGLIFGGNSGVDEVHTALTGNIDEIQQLEAELRRQQQLRDLIALDRNATQNQINVLEQILAAGGTLSPQQSRELARLRLELAQKTQDLLNCMQKITDIEKKISQLWDVIKAVLQKLNLYSKHSYKSNAQLVEMITSFSQHYKPNCAFSTRSKKFGVAVGVGAALTAIYLLTPCEATASSTPPEGWDKCWEPIAELSTIHIALNDLAARDGRGKLRELCSGALAQPTTANLTACIDALEDESGYASFIQALFDLKAKLAKASEKLAACRAAESRGGK